MGTLGELFVLQGAAFIDTGTWTDNQPIVGWWIHRHTDDGHEELQLIHVTAQEVVHLRQKLQGHYHISGAQRRPTTCTHLDGEDVSAAVVRISRRDLDSPDPFGNVMCKAQDLGVFDWEGVRAEMKKKKWAGEARLGGGNMGTDIKTWNLGPLTTTSNVHTLRDLEMHHRQYIAIQGPAQRRPGKSNRPPFCARTTT